MALLGGASRPASSCSSPSTSFSSPWRYQVFLSFRGEDTRNNFTAHLHKALVQKGINTYMDNNLERGEDISPALFEAIEGSRISIIILSLHYASSTWCLKELMKILECQARKQQIVLPVFYYVDPSDVRHQTNSFEEDFAKHEVQFKDHKEINVQMWKAALTKVGNLSGFHLTKERNESEFIDEIIQQVDKSIIPHASLHVANYPVGIDYRVQYIYPHLWVGTNDIRMVGILGCGGIGKTTIAKAMNNLIANHFEATCFLPNVRETSSGERGLVKLQEILLSQILGDSKLKVDTDDRGINLIKERICCKRILLILDDVDQLNQLEKLAGDRDWFGSGSRIIITTRDRNVLTNHDVDFIYEVEMLNSKESLQLFNRSAFKGDNPPLEAYRELTEQIISYAGGLPLALQVLGSDLHGKSICEWKSALKDYKESPHQDIQKVLRISYDGLGKKEKNIFLDIACFFKGHKKNDVIKMLDHCGFSAEIGIRRLMDKSLITTATCWYDDELALEMHDLLQEMGREIVREKSPEEPGGRSRIWLYEDVRMVLEENTGTNKIEAIMVKLPRGYDNIQLSPDALMKMKRLRLFIINIDDDDNDYYDYYKDHKLSLYPCFSGEFNSLPNELRVLDWNGYHSPSLPSNFHGKKLSCLRMCGSLIKDVRVLEHMNLTVMNFSRSSLLTKIPNLSRNANLKELILSYCTNLEEIHDSVGLLDKLVKLDLFHCSKLRSFPRSIKLPSLEYLDLKGCSSLLNFPEIGGEMKNLRAIWLSGSGIKELPSSIINISGLRSLEFKCCKNLTHIPGSIFQLQHLACLRIHICPQFRGFREKLMEDNRQFIQNVRVLEHMNLTVMNFSGSNLLTKIPNLSRNSNLKELILSNCTNLEQIHDSVGLLDKLVKLDLFQCSKLRSFPRSIKLPSLEYLDLSGCSSLLNFPEIGGEMKNLRAIWLSGSGIKELPSSIINISGLHSLEFAYCKNLTHLPGSIFQLQHLESLRIYICPQFRGFREKLMEDNRQFMTSIVPNREYKISGSPPRNSSISGLLSLKFSCCENLTHLPGSIFQLQHLESLRIKGCPRFRGFEEKLMEDNRQFMTSIVPNREYEISGSPSRNSSISNDDCYKEAAVQTSKFLSPENLVLSESNRFTNNTWQPNLNELDLFGSGIVSLPASIKRFVRLRSLDLEDCKQLQEISELPQNIERVNASGCISLESFPQVSKKFQFDTSDDSLDKLIWLNLWGCHKMLKKLRNPVLSPWLRTDLRGEIPTSLHEDYVLDGIAYYRRGPPTWFSHRDENRGRISVILQERLEEAITIVLCAVTAVQQPHIGNTISGSASVLCEGRSPRHVEGTTVVIGDESMSSFLNNAPHLFLAYTTVEPSELEGNHFEVEFSASSSLGGKIEIASCEVRRIDEHKNRVETQKRKRDDVLQMDVSNAEPENLLDLLTMIQLYQSSAKLSGKQTI